MQEQSVAFAGMPHEALQSTLQGMSDDERRQAYLSMPPEQLKAYADWTVKNAVEPAEGTTRMQYGETGNAGNEFIVQKDVPNEQVPEVNPNALPQAKDPFAVPFEGASNLTPEEQARYDALVNPPPPRDLGDEALRQLGLTGRYAAEGIMALPATLADFTTKPLLESAFGVKLPEQNAAISEQLSSLGMPSPEGATERVVGDISRAVAGAGGESVLGRALQTMTPALQVPKPSLTQKVTPYAAMTGKALAERPGTQMIASGLGSGAAGVSREKGETPAEQLMAALMASTVPGAASSAIRRKIVGNAAEQQATRDMVQTFDTAGTTPTLGQATGGEKAKKTEELLSALTSTSSIMARKTREQEAQIGARVRQNAEALGGDVSPTAAGNAVADDLRDNWKPWAQDRSGHLYKVYENVLPKNTRVPVPNFEQTLGNMAKPIPGHANLSENRLLRDPELAQLYQQYKADAKAGTVSLEALSELRQGIGRQLSKVEVNPDRDEGQLKSLYAALSTDERAAAAAADKAAIAAGKSPNAVRSLEKAFNFTKEFHANAEHINKVLRAQNLGGEKVFEAFLSGTKNGATVASTVMQNLRPPAQKQLAASVLEHIFRAPGAKQDAVTQGATDLSTAFQRWNNLAPEMKELLTGRFGPEFKKNFDAVTTASQTIKDSGVSTSDAGKTGLTMLMAGTLGLPTTAYYGGAGPAAMYAGTLGASFFGPRWLAFTMTNPDTVRFLARASTYSAAQLPAAINVFVQQHRNDEDPQMQAFVAELQKSPKE